MNEERRDERFATLALAAAVVMLPPFLGIFNTETLVFGLPLLFFYLFTVWGVVIALAAALTRGHRLSHPNSEAPPAGLGRHAFNPEDNPPEPVSRVDSKNGQGG